MISDYHVMALLKEYKKFHNIKLSSLKVGMNRKTAAKYLKSTKLPSESKKSRNWRTHPDKLISIWDLAESFLEVDPDIEATALFEHLLEENPDKLDPDQRRTFQRRVKNWRIKNGGDKEVYFDQITIPGRMAQVDWLDMNQVNICIDGIHYKHKLIHFILNHSNVESLTICKSESVLAIKNGLRDFLYKTVSKAPIILQIDNSSAATHWEKKGNSKRIFNTEYLQILDYYGIIPQKNNVGKPNENGVVESHNGHVRNKIIQALKIRGNKNFSNLGAYQEFIDKIIIKANKRREKRFSEEFPHLKDIPSKPLPIYQEHYLRVRNRSVVCIKGITYSVPSKLIGATLKAKIYEEKIELLNGVNIVYSFHRVLGDREVIINYRHIIHSLLRKPGAFENYKYKEKLYPTGNFKKAYNILSNDKNLSQRSASLEYLRILKLAADNMEEDVDTALELIIASTDIELSIENISNLILDKTKQDIDPMEFIPNLNIYDDLFLNKEEQEDDRIYQ